MGSKRRPATFALIAVILVAAGGPVVATALTEAFEIVVVAPDRTYRVGDTVNAIIYVFDEGVLADPSNLMVGIDLFPNAPRPVNFTRTAIGTFASTFRILASDLQGFSLFPGHDTVIVEANATLANKTDRGSLYLGVIPPAPPPLEARLSVSPTQVAPGDAFNISIQVLRDGAPRDADSLALTVYPDPMYPESVTTQRIGLGTYKGSYLVPDTISHDTSLWVLARVRVASDEASNGTDVMVKVARPFVIWYSLESANETTYVIGLHVADGTGWPVVAADVNVSYRDPCSGVNCYVTRWASGTTDPFGKVTLTLTHYLMPFRHWWFSFLEFQGTVTKGSTHQTFEGFTLAPAPAGYFPVDPVFMEDSYRTYAPGETVFVNFTLSPYAYPVAFSDAYYYAYTHDRIVANGTTYVDFQGHVTFHFTMPPAPVALRVSVNMSGYWLYGRSAVFPTNTSAIHVGDIEIGGVTPISVSLPPGLVSSSVVIGFMPYNGSRSDPFGGSSWYPLSGYGMYWDEVRGLDSAVEYGLALPRYLPKDETYILIVQLGGVLSIYGLASAVYTQVVHIQNQAPRASAAFVSNDITQDDAFWVDASGSFDPDGLITGYQVDWGDGAGTNWSLESAAAHTYPAPGLYVVTVRVKDDSGALNETSYAVRVESAVLGIRSSLFWAGAGMVGVAIVAAALFAIWARRRKQHAATPPTTENSPPGGAA